jgi:hypothetical protein
METDKNKNKNTSTNDKAGTATKKKTAPGLWDRIQAQHPVLSGDMAFLGRLRAEGVLSDPDPGPLILEYLRFAYLAWTDPAGATPSKTVDEVWHTHILFTRSYGRFCAATRGETLHHDPGGGDADEARFQEAYRRTLERYEAEFGPPPTRFWPRPAGPPEAKATPPAATKPPAPRPPPSSALPLVTAAIGGFLFFLATASPFGALTGALLGGMLGILVSASGPATAQDRRARGRTSGSNTSTSSSDGGGFVSAGDATACGDAGGSCGDGGGGGSSCGSSCGGGGCGGG